MPLTLREALRLGPAVFHKGNFMNTEHYLLQFFKYEHLPAHLQQVSTPFFILAHDLCVHLPDNPERTTALRKLLEAKDCAVRAVLFK
jgi:hypothetical protein